MKIHLGNLLIISTCVMFIVTVVLDEYAQTGIISAIHAMVSK
jgi:hypothetical protein